MATRELRLPAAEAQAVALVRAVEEVDRRGELLGHERRRQATAAARAGGREDDARWLGRRAVDLAAELEEQLAGLRRFRRLTDPGRGLVGPTVAAAFLLGLATNALGPHQRIHVLALPLAGLLLWNVAVVLLLVLRRFLPLPSSWRDARPAILGWLEGASRRLASRLPRSLAGAEDEGALRRVELWRQVLAAYLREWLPAVSSLGAARLRHLLHVGALALVAGAVAGMYLRGLVLEYRATWESTFVGPAAVDRLLALVLGPAAALLDVPAPDAASIKTGALDATRRVIHLWAATAVLFVGLPRLLLAGLESFTVVRLARRLRLAVPDAYLRRLLAAVSTAAHRIEVLPFSYRPAAAVGDRLRAVLHDVYGARAEVRMRAPLEYGADPAALDAAGSRAVLVLFNLAQTPEVEVHGELLAALRDALPDGHTLAAVVDASPYREHLPAGEAGDRRLAERQRAWDLVAATAEVRAVHVDLRSAPTDTVIAALVAGTWPPGSLG